MIDWLVALAADARRRLMVRLVKGAYWDTEIKRAQERGLAGYPVFTRKQRDRRVLPRLRAALLAAGERDLSRSSRPTTRHTRRDRARAAPARAATSSSSACTAWARRCTRGRGRRARASRAASTRRSAATRPARLSRAPLLENGANTSFVNQIGDPDVPLERLVADPIEALPRPMRRTRASRCRATCCPPRRNSRGRRPRRSRGSARLARRIAADRGRRGAAAIAVPARSPSPPTVAESSARAGRDAAELDAAVRSAAGSMAGAGTRRRRRARARVARARRRPARGAIGRADARCCVREAGKTLPDAVAEVREAVDFCRYYALRRARDFAAPLRAARPDRRSERAARCTGAACSPASARGTSRSRSSPARSRPRSRPATRSLAKPAEQTPLIAARAVALLHEAGVPRGRAALAARAPAQTVGARARPPPARRRRRASPARPRRRARSIARSPRATGPIVPLIAETGGQNAMIVDSSALPEQVVADAVASAFQQRRPALLGAARAVRAGRHRRPRIDRDARRRDGASCASATRRCSRPTSAR